MNVKKIRRVCDVRGCKNKDTYTITRRSETGNSIIICEDCLKEALAAVKAMKPKKTKVKDEDKNDE